MMEKIQKIFQILKKLYPEPKTELNYSTPFQLMIAVILSAQTTDKQVNKVTKSLFEKVKSPRDLLDGKWMKGKRGTVNGKRIFESFEKAISGVNYYKTKAKNIRKLAEMLKKSSLPLHSVTPPTPSKIEGALQSLMKLPGIGIKSAKVIGHVLWGLPVIAVDTHVHRVVNRWGIMKTVNGKWGTVNGTNTPEETSEILEEIIPLQYKNFAHHAMVLFGRYVCTAKNPKCLTCELKKYCDYYAENF